ncbi:MAG: hypothetical protein IJ517_03575 [Alphaproteobacteria bacterium]|nr:hypothetical protein [Alphaproteobacteria bacterium]
MKVVVVVFFIVISLCGIAFFRGADILGGGENVVSCPKGSSDRIISQDDCSDGQAFECWWVNIEDDSRRCFCGKCVDDTKQ